MSLPKPKKTVKLSARQGQDRLKGFAYFETFDAVLQWRPDTVDALQISNTPLLARPASPPSPGCQQSNVMLIHDYAGGYNDYEACQQPSVPHEMYSCEYLQYVETFVYFTHKLVSIPPPTWTNTCHRNGVLALGTFIVEPGSKNVNLILEQDQGSYWLAHRLAQMAKAYRFDGWLINIETTFALLLWNSDKLVGFLDQLRAELGANGKVVWYDGLTVLNIVWYQNTLNSLNLRFARAAGSILTNYAWTPILASTAKFNASLNGIDLKNVYIGIDVWAQNEQHGRNKRVTYPVEGGGGTGTGWGMNTISDLGLGTGIFAPAWPYEHFPGHGKNVEQSMWEGKPLPAGVTCDCSNPRQHSAVPYRCHPIVRHAARHVVGSRTFFHTEYRRAFESSGHGKLTSALGDISPLPLETCSAVRPSRPGSHPICGTLKCQLADSPPRCTFELQLDALPASMNRPRKDLIEVSGRIVVHELMLDGQTEFEFEAEYTKPVISDASIDFVVQNELDSYSIGTPHEAVTHGKAKMRLRFKQQHAAVTCGVSIKFHVIPAVLMERRLDVLDIFSITIRPATSTPLIAKIIDAWLEKCEEDDSTQWRLLWTISPLTDATSRSITGLPFSHVTGPFSYFDVTVNGRCCGRAYALEFTLDLADHTQAIPEGRQTGDIKIAGFGFDGRQLAERSVSSEKRGTSYASDDSVAIDGG